MKKKVRVVVVVIASALALSSCSYNTCPTYAKKPVKNGTRATQETRL